MQTDSLLVNASQFLLSEFYNPALSFLVITALLGFTFRVFAARKGLGIMLSTCIIMLFFIPQHEAILCFALLLPMLVGLYLGSSDSNLWLNNTALKYHSWFLRHIRLIAVVASCIYFPIWSLSFQWDLGFSITAMFVISFPYFYFCGVLMKYVQLRHLPI